MKWMWALESSNVDFWFGPTFTSCVTLQKLLELSEPQFSQLKSRDINIKQRVILRSK